MRTLPVSTYSPSCSSSGFFVPTLLIAVLCVLPLCAPAMAQEAAQPAQTAAAPRPLITQLVDESQLTVLKGNTYPLARPQNDLGTAPASLPMERMLLVLKRSPEQEFALRKLIDDQQDRHSVNFHNWVEPEEFGKQFGPADADIQTITAWLQSHGFQVKSSKGRTVLEFSGSASQVQEAFHTTIHKYIVNGEQHWANASDPMIPTALVPAVAGVLSLHNFPARAFHKDVGVLTRNKATGEVKPLHPLFTFNGSGCGVQGSPCYGVGPYDFATIYNVAPLWSGSPVVDGTGQTVAIVAETDINTQDVTDFRNFFGLPAANLQVIHDGAAPGIVGDETESDLDVQWSGAVAKGATIDFVVSASTDTTFGVALSSQYIVDNNLAPVMSMSYGLCELGTGTTGNQFWSQLWQQAAAQGITAIVSSGDSGAAGCDSHDNQPPAPSLYGLAVTGWGDTPYNVSVGGTDFFDLTATEQAQYWSTTNAATTQASAKSYIPEATWNDTCTNSVFGDLLGYSSNAEINCNNSQLQGFVNTVGGSGGLSNCTTNDGQTTGSCTGGYPTPSWQTGNLNSTRGIPDVSLFAAAGSPSGSFYIICEADAVTSGSSCDPSDPNTSFFGIGGTSASAPAFAGIMALVNQQMQILGKGNRQGNANYVLYQMNAQQPTAFHDVSQGTIRMPCATGYPNCNTAFAGDPYGVLAGYDAATGYDLATGLGSVNADTLVTKWSTVVGSFRPTTTTLALSKGSITHGAADTVTITVAPNSGTGSPTGLVSLIADVGIAAPNGSGQTGVQQFTLSGSGTVSLPTSLLPGGGANPYSVFARYVGDGTFAASDSTTVSVKVTPESSTTTLTAQTFSLSGSQLSTVPMGSGTAYGNLVYLASNVSGASKNGFPTGSVAFNDAAGDPTIPGNPYGLNAGTNMNPGVSTALTAQGLYTLPPGNYSITANYGGDLSFNTSASTPVAFTITKAPTTASTLACTINGSGCGTVYTGTSVTLSMNVATGTASVASFGAAPTGTVSFFSNGTLVGSPQPVTGVAGTGSYTLGSFNSSYATASLTTAALPLGNDVITAVYNGDSNYAASPASAGITVTVSAPDFSISAPQVGVTQGNSTPVTITVTALGNFTGVVSGFTCSNLPAEATCGAPSPATVTGAGSTSITITTAALGTQRHRAANDRPRISWIAVAILPLLGICLIGVTKRPRASVVALMILCVVLLPACGGGGPGTVVTNNPVPSVSSLSPTQEAAGSQSQTLTINGSGFIGSSSVTYNGTVLAASVSSGSEMTVSLRANDLLTQGQYPVVVTNPSPGGGASSPVNFNVVSGTPTGQFPVTVTAVSGTAPNQTTHTTTFTLVVE